MTTQYTGTAVLSSDEVISLAEIKLHLRIDTNDEDTLLSSLIIAAKRYVEEVTRRQLLTSTKILYLDSFSSEIRLSKPPAQSVTSIQYIDIDGDTQTVDSSVYEIDTSVEPATINLAYGQSWPSVRGDKNCITVTFVAGYGTKDDVPEMIKTAIKLIVGGWYEHREGISPLTIKKVPQCVDSILLLNKVYTELFED